MDTAFLALYGLTIFVNLLVFLSSVDDTFIDAYFWTRALFRRLTIERRFPQLRLEGLHGEVERPFVIMVPAWKEFEVIAKMIENANATLDYRNFHIFVGTYANDGETQAEVNRMARRYRNVHRVEVPHPGPTCKADCLNAIVGAIFEHERQAGSTFAGFVIHDSEDVIHPLELKVFNHLVDRKDLIQLPVLSLEREWTQWVAGTYQDDFAEWHSKDLVVRESMTDLVPCAGTGMCYSRRALAALSEEKDQAPFNTSTLTEDYDFSFRLEALGMKQAFVKIPLHDAAGAGHLEERRRVDRFNLLGVRELFPSTFRTAYRQRARWILGIGLQGWETIGWKGDLKSRYFMFRDRKGLLTSLVTILGYFLFLGFAAIYVAGSFGQAVPEVPPSLKPDWWLWQLMQVNACFMLNRVVQRFFFVRRLYGTAHGLLSIPRIFVSNLLNFAATMRAWRLYIGHLITGRPLAWDKTAHAYPTTSALPPGRRKLGEILLAWSELNEQRLGEALLEQRTTGSRLGRILMERCGLPEALLADALADQAGLPRSVLKMCLLEETQNLLPRALVLRHGWVPLGIGEEEELLLGVSAPPSDEAYAEALERLRVPPRFFLLTESETSCALAYLIVNGVPGPSLEPTTATLLEGFLGLKVDAAPASLALALAAYAYAEHGSLPAYLADRDLLERHPTDSPARGPLPELAMRPVPVAESV